MSDGRADRLTHVDESGAARMVDVSGKEVTAREAVADRPGAGLAGGRRAAARRRACPRATPSAVARIAGIMAAKRTPDLIPLCHPLRDLRGHGRPGGRRRRRRDHRDRAHHRPHRRRDGGADRGRRSPALTVIDMVKAVDKARGDHRRPGRGQDRRQERRLDARDERRREPRPSWSRPTAPRPGSTTTRTGPLIVDGAAPSWASTVDGPVVVPDGDAGRRRRSRRPSTAGARRRAHHRRHRPDPDRPHPGGHPRRCSTARCPASPRRSGRTASRKGVPTAALSRGLAGVARHGAGRQPARLARRREGRARGARARCSCTRSSRSSGATTEPRGAPGRWSLDAHGAGRAAAAGASATARAWREVRGAQRRLAAAVGRDRRRRGAPGAPRTLPRDGRATCAAQARAGTALPFAVDVRRRASSARSRSATSCGGSAQFASVGYWIDQRVRRPRRHADGGGDGRSTTASSTVGLHRIEVAIRPENTTSLRVVEKLGLPRGRLRARATCTSTATGATTGCSRSPREEVPAGPAAPARRPRGRRRFTSVTRVISRHTGTPAGHALRSARIVDAVDLSASHLRRARRRLGRLPDPQGAQAPRRGGP